MTGPDLAELLELPWRVWPPEERATRPADTYDVLVASGSEVRVNLTFAAASSIAAAVNALPALLDAAAERDALAAKVERVRALHHPHDHRDASAINGPWHCCVSVLLGNIVEGDCDECRCAYPCPTVRALDEEPLP